MEAPSFPVLPATVLDFQESKKSESSKAVG